MMGDLYNAAKEGNKEGEADCARMLKLLDAVAEADGMVDAKDTNGKVVQTTALMQVVWNNRLEAVELLLDHKADPNLVCTLADSDGFTPLMCAAPYAATSKSCTR